ncbi:HalOD1 output domain-containing protein [Halomarina salina]|uniref:HalOD1 output domain-containing protein n=1 Tax=Halomarina salina TaxID=1872699 RepID=A0ABD5RGT8_9EURY
MSAQQQTQVTDRSRQETPGEALMEEWSRLFGADGPRLYDVVDPDALDALFGARADDTPLDGTVSFNFRGLVFTISSCASVTVEDAEHATKSTTPQY